MYFVPEATLSGFASALGSCRCLLWSVSLGLWTAVGIPQSFAVTNVLSSAYFIFSNPRLPGKRWASDQESQIEGIQPRRGRRPATSTVLKGAVRGCQEPIRELARVSRNPWHKNKVSSSQPSRLFPWV